MQLYLTSHGSLATQRATPATALRGALTWCHRREVYGFAMMLGASCGQTKGGSSYLTDAQLAGCIAHFAMSKSRPRNTMRLHYAATARAFAIDENIAAILRMAA